MQSSTLSQLVNAEFIQQYNDRYGSSILKTLEVIKAIYASKPQQQNKKCLLLDLLQKVSVLHKDWEGCSVDFDQVIESKRNTEFNMLVTELLFSNPNSRKKIEQLRINTLQYMKKPHQICFQSFTTLYTIYKKYYFGSQSLSYQRITTVEGLKTLKTILTSLKKMIVPKPKKSKKAKQVSTQPYYINLDTRTILQMCEFQALQLMEKQLASKIKGILQEKKKWIGPRIWKIVKQNFWDKYEIELFITLIENAHASLKEIKSDAKEIRKHIQKILSNLKALHANTVQSACSSTEVDFGEESEIKSFLNSKFSEMEDFNGMKFEFKNIEQMEDMASKEQDHIFEEEHFWM